MSTRTDSYLGSNGQILTSGSFAGQAALVGSGRVKVVAADTQFDLTGSNAGNHSFMHNAAESDTVFTFADGSTATGADIVKNIQIEAPVQKVVTGGSTKVVIFWK